MTQLKLPQHIAFIMDGNGRWAEQRGWARLAGHRQGIETVQTVTKECLQLGIPFVTLYAFSMENWRRPLAEVRGLFNLMRDYFTQDKVNELNEKNIRVRFIGNRAPTGAHALDADILTLMTHVETATAQNQAITLTFAVNYSGRDEVLRAARHAVQVAVQGGSTELTEGQFQQYLDTHDIPDPDLMIRTSGEQRLSNFLLWQVAYAEFMFHPATWPEFGAAQLQECLQAYTQRDRRFGGVNGAPYAAAAKTTHSNNTTTAMGA